MSESIETKRILDYEVGDLVQIVDGDKAGSLGKILNIKLSADQTRFKYEVFVKAEGILLQLSAYQIRFLRHQDED